MIGESQLADSEVRNKADRLIKEIQFKQRELERLLQNNTDPDTKFLSEDFDKNKPKKKESIKELIEKEKEKYNRSIEVSKESITVLKEKLKELAEEEKSNKEESPQVFDSIFDDSTRLSHTPPITSSPKLVQRRKDIQRKGTEKFRDIVCEGCNIL